MRSNDFKQLNWLNACQAKASVLHLLLSGPLMGRGAELCDALEQAISAFNIIIHIHCLCIIVIINTYYGMIRFQRLQRHGQF